MRIIVGYGNSLRGEDAFGVDIIQALQKYPLKDTLLIETFQLTPELCLELKDADEIIFVDVAYSKSDHYKLACPLSQTAFNSFSHHVSPQVIISFLNTLYNVYPNFEIYSMLTNSFEEIKDLKKYQDCIGVVSSFFKKL